jgi:hypothetical protein
VKWISDPCQQSSGPSIPTIERSVLEVDSREEATAIDGNYVVEAGVEGGVFEPAEQHITSDLEEIAEVADTPAQHSISKHNQSPQEHQQARTEATIVGSSTRIAPLSLDIEAILPGVKSDFISSWQDAIAEARKRKSSPHAPCNHDVVN